MQMANKKLFHAPVLAPEILAHLITENTRVFFDGTLGLGGHASFLLENAPQLETYVGTDLDQQHLDFATERLSPWVLKLQLHKSNFSALADLIPFAQNKTVSILLDLGLCSNQVDDATKGFSFKNDGPLHMAFDNTTSDNAEKIINEATRDELTKIFRDYGEEPRAWAISGNIIKAREHQSLRTTAELSKIIEDSVDYKDQKKAQTRVFQALRIAVNDEFGHLEKALQGALDNMQPADRLGIITYHSLEDRIVKKFFKKHAQPITKETDLSLHTVIAPAAWKLHNKKPITPTGAEVEENPRARSAKLRIVEKC